MEKYAIKNPIFKPSPITPKYDDYLIFEGISVDEGGKQHYLDVHVLILKEQNKMPIVTNGFLRLTFETCLFMLLIQQKGNLCFYFA